MKRFFLPDHDASALVSSTRTWSARELQAAVDEAGDALDALPPGPVALAGDRSARALVRWLALLQRERLGVALHPRWPEARVDAVLQRTGCVARWDDTLTPQAGAPPVGAPTSGVIMHTSGTTGTPKGVWISLDNLDAASRAHAEHLPWQADDRWLLSIPSAHIGGLALIARCVRSHTLPGANAAVAIGSGSRFAPEAWCAEVAALQVTHVSVVPTMLHRLVRSECAAPLCVRAMLVGGAAASEDLIARARRLGWPALRTYGATECTAQAFTERLTDLRGTRLAAPSPGVGPPLPGVEYRIDREDRLWLRGPSVATRTFPDTPALPLDAGGWLDTGDFVRATSGGSVQILARRTELVVSGGENVYPAMVEGVLAAHPAVSDVAVVGAPDDEWGERVVAFVVWDVAGEATRGAEPGSRQGPRIGAGHHADARALARFADEHLAPFERPREYRTMRALPLTPGLKLDRAALRGVAAE